MYVFYEFFHSQINTMDKRTLKMQYNTVRVVLIQREIPRIEL
jgi:hypothetical protein